MLFSDLLCFILLYFIMFDTERRRHISITKNPQNFINNTQNNGVVVH